MPGPNQANPLVRNLIVGPMLFRVESILPLGHMLGHLRESRYCSACCALTSFPVSQFRQMTMPFMGYVQTNLARCFFAS
jgi:hypothetical protein